MLIEIFLGEQIKLTKNISKFNQIKKQAEKNEQKITKRERERSPTSNGIKIKLKGNLML